MTRILWIVCAMALGGCAPPVTTTTTDAAGVKTTVTTGGGPLASLSAFTVADLQNADKIAVAAKDVLAHACYPALIVWIQSLPSASASTTVSGAVSAFELARVTRIGLTGSGGIPDSVKLGCGGLLMDEQTLLLRLGAMVATPLHLP